MHNKKSKVKTTTRALLKCNKRFTSYSDTQLKFSYELEKNDEFKEIRVNVPIDIDYGDYTSDFVCVKDDETLVVFECILKRHLYKPQTIKLLDASRNYWLRKGVKDFRLVLGVKDEDS